MENIKLKAMTTDQLSMWFKKIKLPKVAEKIKSEGIDGEAFFDFDENEYAEIGIPRKGFKWKQFNVKLNKLKNIETKKEDENNKMEEKNKKMEEEKKKMKENMKMNVPHTSTTWSCERCTFINESSKNTCEMCGSKNPSSLQELRYRKKASQRILDFVDGNNLQNCNPIFGIDVTPVIGLEKAIDMIKFNGTWMKTAIQFAYLKAETLLNNEQEHFLNKDELAIIHMYTMQSPFYEKLNNALRSEDRRFVKPYFAVLKLFLTALHKLPPVTEQLWRGVKKDLSHCYEINQTYIWWAFSSFTTSLHVLEEDMYCGKSGKRTIFNLRTRGVNIKEYSAFGKEDEILVLPGTSFTVLSKMDCGNGLTIIDLKENTSVPLLDHGCIWPDQNVFLSKHNLTENQDLWNLQKHRIIDHDCEIMSCILKTNTNLTNLNLRGNHISNVGAEKLAKGLEVNTVLKELALGDNQINDSGAAAITEALKTNAIITKLDLYKNSIGDAGATAIEQALKINSSLNSLKLYWNEIGDAGTTAIAEALKVNCTITSLNLAVNEIGDEGATAIGEVLKTNTIFTTLYLCDNNISTTKKTELTLVMKNHVSLNFEKYLSI